MPHHNLNQPLPLLLTAKEIKEEDKRRKPHEKENNKDKYHRKQLMQVLKIVEAKPALILKGLMPTLDENWCSFHYHWCLSLHQVTGTYEVVFYSVDLCQSKHVYLLGYLSNGQANVFATEEEDLEPSNKSRKFVAIPCDASNHLDISGVAKNLATVIKEIWEKETRSAFIAAVAGFHQFGTLS